MALPNTVLAGAQKSGTTALCRFIDAHPDCLVSTPKEPNFFSRAANLGRLDAYHRCFREAEGRHRIRLDGTTTYMADPAIPPRIRDSLGPDTKIIFILRAPAARTYSSYLHMVKRGHERRTAEEVFLDLPEEPGDAAAREAAAAVEAASSRRIVSRPYQRLYDDVLWNYRYVGNSLYRSLIDNYLGAFAPENILILFFEEVAGDAETTRLRLGQFLGVDPELFPKAIARDNATRVPDVSTAFGWLTEQARWIKRGNFTLVRPSEIAAAALRPPPAVTAKLRRIFAAEVAYWSGETGRDLGAAGW